MGEKLRSLTSAMLWVGFFAALVVASLSAGWGLLAARGFGYRTLYSVLHIDETINQYGPLNKVRPDFQRTNLDERQRLFVAIVQGVHQHGDGLDTLVYRAADGTVIGSLLTPAEILHLQDVARLVAILRPVGWAALVLVISGSVWLRRGSILLPGKKVVISSALLVVGIAGLLSLVGAEAVFYQLHRGLFPPNHQWFFYYEESLMSMMMQAPNLFGAIALVWVLVAIAVLMGWYWLVGRRLR